MQEPTKTPARISRSCHLGEHKRCQLANCACHCHAQRRLFDTRDRFYAERALEAYWRTTSYAHAGALAELGAKA